MTRERLPDERRGLTHHFEIRARPPYGTVDGYVSVGFYDDGRPGEVLTRLAKQGSTISCLIDAWATAVSLALQHGCPLRTIVDKFSYTKFEPAGLTGQGAVPMAQSPLDYICRWMGMRFLDDEPLDGEPPSPTGREDVVARLRSQRLAEPPPAQRESGDSGEPGGTNPPEAQPSGPVETAEAAMSPAPLAIADAAELLAKLKAQSPADERVETWRSLTKQAEALLAALVEREKEGR